MSFEIKNRYWLNRFLEDVMVAKEKELGKQNFSSCTIKEYGKIFIYHKRCDPGKRAYFQYLINAYKNMLVKRVIKIDLYSRYRGEKALVFQLLRETIENYDKENQLNLHNVKFELITLDASNPFGAQYYLVVCDIDKLINFELTYGTLKIMNKL